MSYYKVIFTAGILSTALLFTACSRSNPTPKGPKPMDTRGKTETYVRGAEDGCTTANGDYTKNHDDFNNDIEYHEGWFAGRRYCEIRRG